MANDWIIDVLADLRDFAQANGLDELASKTEETLQTARQELAEQHPLGLRCIPARSPQEPH